MNKNQGKLLLFDCDGVIIDSLDHIYQGALDFVKHHGGKPFTKQQYIKAFKGNVISEMFLLAGLSAKNLEITQEDMALFFVHYHKTKVFPGMKELLQDLAKENTLVIITSTLVEVITKKFEEENILQLFSGFLGPVVSPFKDKKVAMALEEFGFDKNNAVFISDTSGDINEVKKTGIKTIGVTWGVHNRSDLEEAEPTLIVENIKDLKKSIYD